MDYCSSCSNTGRYKKPNNEAEFDRLFEYYDSNTPSNDQCYEKAINEVGYTIITPCPYCNRESK